MQGIYSHLLTNLIHFAGWDGEGGAGILKLWDGHPGGYSVMTGVGQDIPDIYAFANLATMKYYAVNKSMFPL